MRRVCEDGVFMESTTWHRGRANTAVRAPHDSRRMLMSLPYTSSRKGMGGQGKSGIKLRISNRVGHWELERVFWLVFDDCLVFDDLTMIGLSSTI